MPGILDNPVSASPVLQMDPAQQGFHATGPGILGSIPTSAADFKALNATRGPNEAKWLKPTADAVKEGNDFTGYIYHTGSLASAPSIQSNGIPRGGFFAQDFVEPPPGMEGQFPTYRVRKENHPMVVDSSAGRTDFRALGQIAPQNVEQYMGNGNWQPLTVSP